MPELTKYQFVLAYFIFISIIAVIATVKDKIKAKLSKHRTPEIKLLLLSVLGGSVAMLLTMLLIKHKTKHKKFMLGIPMIIILQIAAIYFAHMLI